MRAKTQYLLLLLLAFMAQLTAHAQGGVPLRRPVSPQQPMWLIHIDTWNYADPQKIIALIPADIRPHVVMNISLSISHNETTSRFQVAEYGYQVAKSWLRACAENRMWAMVQPSSGGFSQFSDFDLSVYKIYGSTAEPAYSWTDRANHQASTVSKDWTAGVLTLTVAHNGALDITVNCAGMATGRLTAYNPANITAPVRPAAFAGPRQYEAECFDYKSISGITAGGQNDAIRNYTGQGYLQFGTDSSAAVRDSVSVLKAGTYRLETRYAVTGTVTNSVNLYVNGVNVATPAFAQTVTLSEWAIHKQNITLSAGTNTIEFRASAGRASSLYFDNIVVVPTTFAGGLVIQENGTGFGGVDGTIDSSPARFTGSSYANAADATGTGIDWWLDFPAAGTDALTFRYASLEDRTADLHVKGVKAASNVFFPSTGSLTAWELVTVHANVPAGLSNVRLQAVSANGLPNIDFLGLGGDAISGSASPLADAYARGGGSAATNFGTSSQLVAKHDTADLNFSRVSYLKFDVSDLTNAQGVKLKLVPFQVDGAATLAFERIADDSWLETAMTWNNHPTGTGTLIANLAGYAVGQQIELDVTAAAKSEAAGDGILSLRVSNDGWNFIGFHSRESTTAAFRPVLEYTVAAQTVRPGAVKKACLRFDDGSGTTAVDSTGNGWNGTLVNSPTWVSGTNARIRGAVNLNGANQHVTLPAGIVSTLNEFTIVFWIRLSSINTWARVFDFNNGTTASSMYFVPQTSGGVTRFGLNGQNLETSTGNQFTTNTWTHVAVTLSGNTATMYLNGTAVATRTTMTNRPSGLGFTPNNFIGRSASNADPYLNGRLDEFRIYEVPLSASKIASDVLAIHPRSFAEWEEGAFTPEDITAGLGGPAGDPDGDRLTNLAEYALGGDSHSHTPQPVVNRTPTELSITFQRPAHIGDITYHAEVSGEMSAWQDLALVVLNPGSDPETVRATKTFTEPVPERQFIRLRFVK